MSYSRLGILGKSPLQILRELGGYYKCPRGPNNEVLGPLVGYAGTYPVQDDGFTNEFHYVGFEYANFGKAEPYRFVTDQWCEEMCHELVNLKPTVFVGMPMGGLFVADSMGRATGCRVIYAEKKVTKVATADSKEESELVWGRHQPEAGDQVVIAEDVLNNFSTTGKALALVRAVGAEVVGIAGLLNRSPEQVREFDGVPVVARVSLAIAEYRQDDPEVAEQMAAGNVVWNPKRKEEWAKLEAAMAQHNS